MDALQSTATTALRSMLSGQPNTPAKVTFAWQIAAGPAISRASTATWSADGVLRVEARSESWRREIARGRPVILERLKQLLGPDLVRTLKVDSSDPGVPRPRDRRRHNQTGP